MTVHQRPQDQPTGLNLEYPLAVLRSSDLTEPEAQALATALFYILRDRSAADGMLVYRALDARFPQEADDEKLQWCIDGMRACKADLDGQDVSKKRYHGWHCGLPDMSVWPSARVIFTTFGSWEDARAAADGLPKPDPLAKRLTRTGEKSTPARLLTTLAAWKAYMEEHGFPARLTLDAFRAWAREQRGDPTCTLLLPLTAGPWTKWFGGWGDALKAAGLIPEDAVLAPQARQAPSWVHVTDEVLLTLLGLVAETLNAVPYTTAFDRTAGEVVTAHPELMLRDTPRSALYSDRFGSWADALRRAGLITKKGAARRPRAGGGAFTNAYALWCAARAVSRLGPALKTTPYRKWRSDQLAKRKPREPGIPSDAWMRTRFGSLEEAGRQALEKFPELCQPAEVRS